jgi:sialic acid synthase SpsE/mannose-6-phosphate isomerase-like protein (cupin superfamily)
MRDRQDIKHVKRFNETRLSRAQFDQLVAVIKGVGFRTMVTPFDEDSVDIIEAQSIEIIKIASCSFNDWPLLERIAKTDKPIIASTAGATIEALDAVISFLKHRNKDFAILHCVAEYPADSGKMELNQIEFLRSRYPGLRVGFSTHEAPEDTEIAKLAVAKGADIFEKHVGVATNSYALNAYSATPEQVAAWLHAIRYARSVCGFSGGRSPVNPTEQESLLSLRRGVFARRPIVAGSAIKREDIYFAFPPNDTQYTANDFSKFSEFTATTDIEINNQVGPDNTIKKNTRKKYLAIAEKVKNLLLNAKINPPKSTGLEISHHYGIDNFEKFGLVMITVINREYCKKLLMILPGQKHPEQYHEKKEETFHMLYGDLKLELNGKSKILKAGDIITILPGIKHSFESNNGAVVEEISTNHSKDDSYYTDSLISKNLNRKTFLNYWIDI